MLVFVIEDDKRAYEVSKILLNEGYYVSDYLKDMKYADMIYLGLKGIDSQNRITHQGNICIIDDELFKNLKHGCTIFTIVENKHLRYLESQNDFHYISLMNDKDFLSMNTIMSVEGTLSYLIEKTNKPLYVSHVMILGYGHCAKRLAYSLKAFNCEITIALRKYELKDEIESKGYHCQSLYDIDFKDIDIIINTIPYPVIKEEQIKNIDKETLLIDIASYPYGIDHHEAVKCGLDSYILPAIPSRYFSVYSARCIVDLMIKKGDQSA